MIGIGNYLKYSFLYRCINKTITVCTAWPDYQYKGAIKQTFVPTLKRKGNAT